MSKKHITRVQFIMDSPEHATRFPELRYQMQGAGNWRILDSSTGHAIGRQYLTRVELLADLDRFAKEFGCN